jgi:hypothetical protein
LFAIVVAMVIRYLFFGPKELSGNKRYKLTGDVFCRTKTENVRIPGYVIIFKMQYGEKQTRKCTVYFLTVPNFVSQNCNLKFRLASIIWQTVVSRMTADFTKKRK